MHLLCYRYRWSDNDDDTAQSVWCWLSLTTQSLLISLSRRDLAVKASQTVCLSLFSLSKQCAFTAVEVSVFTTIVNSTAQKTQQHEMTEWQRFAWCWGTRRRSSFWRLMRLRKCSIFDATADVVTGMSLRRMRRNNVTASILFFLSKVLRIYN